MKKAIFILLFCSMMLSVASCNKIDDIDTQQESENPSSNDETEGTSRSTDIPEWDDQSNQNSRPIQSSYIGDSAYIQKPNDLYITEINEQRYFNIPKWEKRFLIAEDFTHAYTTCGFVGEEKAWVFEYEREETENTNGEVSVFTLFKIHRQTGVQEKIKISLPVCVHEYFGGMFCNMLDENVGFLFLFREKDLTRSLVALAKTSDGGESWSTLQYNETWPSEYWRDIILVSHFFDEHNGIIVPRTSAGTNINMVYVTLDGGKNWDLAKIPYDSYDPELSGANGRYLELRDFEFSNGEYILTFRLRVEWADRIDGDLVSFASTDLKTWVYRP